MKMFRAQWTMFYEYFFSITIFCSIIRNKSHLVDANMSKVQRGGCKLWMFDRWSETNLIENLLGQIEAESNGLWIVKQEIDEQLNKTQTCPTSFEFLGQPKTYMQNDRKPITKFTHLWWHCRQRDRWTHWVSSRVASGDAVVEVKNAFHSIMSADQPASYNLFAISFSCQLQSVNAMHFRHFRLFSISSFDEEIHLNRNFGMSCDRCDEIGSWTHYAHMHANTK